MKDLRCWKCRGEEMPEREMERLGLCSDHLRERVNSLMAEKGGTK